MTSLNGQWVGTYSGSNEGRFVIELDVVGNHYEGTAIAWDGNTQLFSALIRVVTGDHSNSHEIKNIPVKFIDNNGNIVPADVIERAKNNGIRYPSTTNIDLKLDHKRLDVNWTTSIETHGKGSAFVPKTREKIKSEIASQALTWNKFKEKVNSLPPKTYIFRGHENKEWRLRSTFYRSGRSDIERYLDKDVADLQKAFSAISPHSFNLESQLHYGAFLNLAQHHGYPTPLLDWTWSPYVAAFFAFHKIPKISDGRDRNDVRVIKFDVAAWTKLYSPRRLFPIWPNVSVLNALAYGNPRAIPQQSISTTSNLDDIESYIIDLEKTNHATYLEAFDLPASERNVAMGELALMGITAGSLFPGLDGVCEGLREQNF